MARLLTCGYETGDIGEAGTSVTGGNMSQSVVGSSPTPRAGNYCWKGMMVSGTDGTQVSKAFTLPSPVGEAWVRCAIYIHAVARAWGFAQWLDSAGGVQGYLNWNPPDRLVRLNNSANANLAVSSTPLSADAWHVLEWRTQILTATTGVTEIWQDGVRVINFSGDNSSTANLNVQTWQVGYLTGFGGGDANGSYIAVDDIAINDTTGTLNNGRPGDGSVRLLAPNGAGSSTVLSRGGTDSGANWNQVDELPPSMTDYVYSTTIGDRDLYAIADAPTTTTLINVVELLALARNSDIGNGSIGLTIKSGATTNEGAAQALTSTAAYVRQRYETDPNTSAAWTLSAVQALEVGVTVR